MSEENETKAIPVNTPEIGDVGNLDTGGMEWSDREFVSKALEAAGAEITDGGFGCGSADLGFRVNGVQFGVKIWKRDPQSQAA